MWHQSRQPAMGCVLGRGDSRIARAIRELPLRHISLNRTRCLRPFVAEDFVAALLGLDE